MREDSPMKEYLRGGSDSLCPGGRHLLYQPVRKKQKELRPKPWQPKLLVLSSLEEFEALLDANP
jgi:hypothetical protein